MNTNQTYHAIVDASDLKIGYHTKQGTICIADNLDIHIYEGEMVCLLGPNGCGKSTLIRTLAGMQKALTGNIYIQGNRVIPSHATQLAKQMSVVLTERIHIPNISVYDLVSLGRFPHTNWFGKLTDTDHEAITKSIAQVGLADLSCREFNTLSDGEKQRAMIAKALTQETPFIMLDEPTAHLDLPNRIEIMKLLKELARTTCTSILLSTHELDLALQVADRIWLMQAHKPLLSGTPEDLVLNGSFEQAFKKQSFDFDISNGLFKINYNHSHNVSLEGDAITVFWTKRALARHAYQVTEKQDTIPHIIAQNSSWEIITTQERQSCKSIFDVLICLNKIIFSKTQEKIK